jgi:hypothetical protein
VTHDEELIERVAKAMWEALPDKTKWHDLSASCFMRCNYLDEAIEAIAAVRAYDAERRASVLDAAALVERYDPDDYRDLPVAMVEPVKFRGGLTEGT